MDGSRLKRRSTAQQPLPHSRGIENIALKRRVQTNFLVKSKGAWRSFSDTFRRGQYSGVHVPKGTKYEPVVEISRTPKIVGKALAVRFEDDPRKTTYVPDDPAPSTPKQNLPDDMNNLFFHTPVETPPQLRNQISRGQIAKMRIPAGPPKPSKTTMALPLRSQGKSILQSKSCADLRAVNTSASPLRRDFVQLALVDQAFTPTKLSPVLGLASSGQLTSDPSASTHSLPDLIQGIPTSPLIVTLNSPQENMPSTFMPWTSTEANDSSTSLVGSTSHGDSISDNKHKRDVKRKPVPIFKIDPDRASQTVPGESMPTPAVSARRVRIGTPVIGSPRAGTPRLGTPRLGTPITSIYSISARSPGWSERGDMITPPKSFVRRNRRTRNPVSTTEAVKRQMYEELAAVARSRGMVLKRADFEWDLGNLSPKRLCFSPRSSPSSALSPQSAQRRRRQSRRASSVLLVKPVKLLEQIDKVKQRPSNPETPEEQDWEDIPPPDVAQDEVELKIPPFAFNSPGGSLRTLGSPRRINRRSRRQSMLIPTPAPELPAESWDTTSKVKEAIDEEATSPESATTKVSPMSLYSLGPSPQSLASPRRIRRKSRRLSSIIQPRSTITAGQHELEQTIQETDEGEDQEWEDVPEPTTRPTGFLTDLQFNTSPLSLYSPRRSPNSPGTPRQTPQRSRNTFGLRSTLLSQPVLLLEQIEKEAAIAAEVDKWESVVLPMSITLTPKVASRTSKLDQHSPPQPGASPRHLRARSRRPSTLFAISVRLIEHMEGDKRSVRSLRDEARRQDEASSSTPSQTSRDANIKLNEQIDQVLDELSKEVGESPASSLALSPQTPHDPFPSISPDKQSITPLGLAIHHSPSVGKTTPLLIKRIQRDPPSPSNAQVGRLRVHVRPPTANEGMPLGPVPLPPPSIADMPGPANITYTPGPAVRWPQALDQQPPRFIAANRSFETLRQRSIDASRKATQATASDEWVKRAEEMNKDRVELLAPLKMPKLNYDGSSTPCSSEKEGRFCSQPELDPSETIRKKRYGMA